MCHCKTNVVPDWLLLVVIFSNITYFLWGRGEVDIMDSSQNDK